MKVIGFVEPILQLIYVESGIPGSTPPLSRSMSTYSLKSLGSASRNFSLMYDNVVFLHTGLVNFFLFCHRIAIFSFLCSYYRVRIVVVKMSTFVSLVFRLSTNSEKWLQRLIRCEKPIIFCILGRDDRSFSRLFAQTFPTLRISLWISSCNTFFRTNRITRVEATRVERN